MSQLGFRGVLNDVTKKNSFSPQIDNTLTTLSGFIWLSTIDLKSEYWEVKFDPANKKKYKIDPATTKLKPFPTGQYLEIKMR